MNALSPAAAATAEKERVAFFSILASGGMTLAKLLAALMTGSLGILSEALHSLLDTAATVMTWFAVRIADKPADDEHHYGHAKIESVAALIETGLLFVTSAWVIYEAVHRLIARSTEVEVHPLAIAIVAGSIAVDFFRARALMRVAKKTGSEALEADALHFSSDMWSSGCVLGGLVVVWIGFPWGDAVAAILVSFFIAHAAYALGIRTINSLLDAAPAGSVERIHDVVERTSGVIAIERVRVRPSGATVFVDLEIAVARTRSFDDLVAIKRQVVEEIGAAMPEAEVSIIAHPRALDDETVHERIGVIARNRGLAIHHLTVQTLPGDRLSVSVDLEVDGRMELERAHQIASGLEDAIAAELGACIEVETHIEPMLVDHLNGVDVGDREKAEVAALIARAASGGLVSDVHDVRARRHAEGLIVNFHCRLAPTMTVTAMHDAIDEIERRVRSERPDILRAIGHAEPIRAARA